MDMGWIHGVLWLILTTLIILLAVKIEDSQNRTLNLLTKTLAWMAQISYPVYLAHQFIGFAILKKLDTYGMTSELFMVIPIGFGLLLGAILHTFVELPAARYLTKKLNIE